MSDYNITINDSTINGLLENDSQADAKSSDRSSGRNEGGSESLTPQDFMSQLLDIADKSEGFGPGEEKMLDLGKKMINATPEQQQAVLDKANEYLDDDGDINETDDKEASMLEAFADGLMADGSESAEESEGVDDEGSFMDKAEALIAESDNDSGPGEKMAREAAKMLEDNPEADQEAFLEQLDKLVNNPDEDYDQDLDETNDGEGTMLKKMAEAFDELPSDRGESSDDRDSTTDSSGGSDGASISNFLDSLTASRSDGGSDVTERELAALRAFVDSTESQYSDEEATAT